MACKRKCWSQQAMEQAVAYVGSDENGLREAARLYNVPVETLRRRVKGFVPVECRPGLPTILSQEEEDRLYQYLIDMSEMGYGLTRKTVMHWLSSLLRRLGRSIHLLVSQQDGRG